MIVQSVDTETTISNIGHAFDQTNKLCAIGSAGTADRFVVKVEHGEEPYGDKLARLRNYAESVDLFVLFNAKFDLTWLWRYGVDLSTKPIWDCQLFEYLASHQTWLFPDLETACEKRGLAAGNVVKEKEIETYWDAGINTPDIPWELVEKRVKGDAELTYQLYVQQVKEFLTWSKARQNLFRLHCSDLIVLHNIERNGLQYDEEASKAEADATASRILELEAKIKDYAPVELREHLNLNSPQQVSVLLYGGEIEVTYRVQEGVYKTGPRAGQPKMVNDIRYTLLPRLIHPLEGTKMEKGEYWSTDKHILGRLLNSRISKHVRNFIEMLVSYSKEQRSISSYTQGLPNLILKMNWPKNMLYGTINQVSVVTGRTSSSKPNLQNFDTSLKHLFRSRYE